MKYVFDIDGTICTSTDGDYLQSKPLIDRIRLVNKLYEEGHIIIFHTARGMGRTDNDSKKSIDLFYDLTLSQLNKLGVKFHDLFLGKPAGDFYIDDKGIKDEEFFTN